MTASDNYFDLFGLPRQFALDKAVLTERYRDLQRQVHPDRFAGASDQERRLSVQRAAVINDAFNTLKSPLERGRYLLRLHGHEVDEENNTAMDPMFLMEQMELREALEGVRGSADPLGRTGELIDELAVRLKKLEAGLGEALAVEAFEAAAGEVRKMQFFAKLLAEAEALEAELEHELDN